MGVGGLLGGWMAGWLGGWVAGLVWVGVYEESFPNDKHACLINPPTRLTTC